MTEFIHITEPLLSYSHFHGFLIVKETQTIPKNNISDWNCFHSLKNFCYNWLGISFTVYKIASLVSTSKMRIIGKNCLKYVGTFASHIAQWLAVLVWAFVSLEYRSLSMMNIDYGRRFGGWMHLIKSFFLFGMYIIKWQVDCQIIEYRSQVYLVSYTMLLRAEYMANFPWKFRSNTEGTGNPNLANSYKILID